MVETGEGACLKRVVWRRLSAMISGNPKVTVTKYSTTEEALVYIDRFIGTDSTSPD